MGREGDSDVAAADEAALGVPRARSISPRASAKQKQR